MKEVYGKKIAQRVVESIEISRQTITICIWLNGTNVKHNNSSKTDERIKMTRAFWSKGNGWKRKYNLGNPDIPGAALG